MKSLLSTPSEMGDSIRQHVSDPEFLEHLFRKNKSVFKHAFYEIWPEIKDSNIAKIWHYRLSSEDSSFSLGKANEWLRVFLLVAVAGLFAKVPDLFAIDQESFLSRNASFIIFPFSVILYYFKDFMNLKMVWISLALFTLLAIYMNIVPMEVQTDTFTLVCLHMPVLVWGISGYFRNGSSFLTTEKWIEFLRFNGDFVVLSGIFILSGFLLTAISVGLFELTGWELESFITGYWLVWGLPAVPILSVFFIQNSPEIVRRISPVIARVFTPMALFILIGFVAATLVSGQNPYYNREFLQIFNVALLGVMSLIFFSLSDEYSLLDKKWYRYLMISLASLTIIVNIIAVSSIIFRISSWGFTPNRVAILGSNVLMLLHLTYTTFMLIRQTTGKSRLSDVHDAVVFFLPVYFIWAALVAFTFPFIFS